MLERIFFIFNNMKVIIAGSRHYGDYEAGAKRLDFLFSNGLPEEVVSGGCSDSKGVHTHTREDGSKVYGADGIGERWAEENGIPVKIFLADWGRHGKVAGPIRNLKMAEYLESEKDGCVVFWNGHSRGSGDMISKAKKCKLILREVIVSVE